MRDVQQQLQEAQKQVSGVIRVMLCVYARCIYAL
jgi:hypothetical protein